jgi:hypothetical protein
MAKKTLYVPDADETTWKMAEELSKKSVSQLVNQLLKEEVAKMETLANLSVGMEEIILEVAVTSYNGFLTGDIEKISFIGKWFVQDEEGYNVALTAKQKLLVYSEIEDVRSHSIFEDYEELEGEDWIPEEVKRHVADALGREHIRFLDI